MNRASARVRDKPPKVCFLEDVALIAELAVHGDRALLFENVAHLRLTDRGESGKSPILAAAAFAARSDRAEKLGSRTGVVGKRAEHVESGLGAREFLGRWPQLASTSTNNCVRNVRKPELIDADTMT